MVLLHPVGITTTNAVQAPQPSWRRCAELGQASLEGHPRVSLFSFVKLLDSRITSDNVLRIECRQVLAMFTPNGSTSL
jgi:hypothetical protein